MSVWGTGSATSLKSPRACLKVAFSDLLSSHLSWASSANSSQLGPFYLRGRRYYQHTDLLPLQHCGRRIQQCMFLVIYSETFSQRQKNQKMHISCSKNSSPTIIPTKPTMENKQCIKLLGVHFSSNLRWDIHTNHVRKQCHSRFYALRVLKPILSHDDLLNVY